MIKIELFTHNDFDKLEKDWIRLQVGKDMTVFQQYIWYKGLNDQYVRNCFKFGEKAVYLVAIKDGVAKMIAPLHIKKFGISYKGIGDSSGIYIIGKWGFTDYLNFIYDEFDSECTDAIFSYIKKIFHNAKFHFNFVIKGNCMESYLNTHYSDKSIGETICVQTLPHDSFEEFHKTMTKYSRQNIRKAFNREEKTNLHTRIEEFKQISEQDAKEFFSIYLDRSTTKNELNLKKDGLRTTILKYFNKRYNDNLKDCLSKSNYIIYNMVHNPNSYMIGIFHDSKKIGFIYGIMEGSDMWRNIIVCFDEEYKYYTPGRTAYFRFFRDILYAEGKGTTVTTDMSRGTERHKYELGGTEHFLVNYVI